MKDKQTKFILFAMFAAIPYFADAQIAIENENDTLSTENDPVVQVAFRKVAQKDLLGGVSVVNIEELTKKNYNTYSLDNMQGYIGGWNGNSLWGMDGDNAGYLVLIDGVPRDANNVMPTEIAQISFLKGAQAVVLYGSKAAKGAILITTKRSTSEGLSVSVSANTGFNVAKSFPEYLGSAEYMTLYNEARVNDGLDPLYSDTQIYNHASGLNPYRYPDINYYSSDYVKKMYNRSEVTAEIEGGGSRAHFYSNISYYRNGDYLNFGEAENNMVDRFNVRTNVDVKINDFIKAYINANATFYNSKSAAAWELLSTSGNIIDGKYFLGGSQANPTNAFADVYAAGSSKYTSRQFQFDTGVDINLNKLLKGLSFKAMFAVDYATSYNTSFDNNYAIFVPTWSNYNGKDVIVSLTKEGVDERPGIQNVGGSTDNQTIAFTGQFNYQNTFNKDHNLSAMLIVNGYQQTKSALYHRICNANLALQAGYNYKQRYYADFGAALIHSAKLAPGHRNALSPSLTLGWRLSEEDFLKDSQVIDEMIFSVSGSILNQDIDLIMNDNEYYLYEGVWTQADGYSWYDGSAGKYTYSTKGQNHDLDFIKRKELSVNLRTSMWNKLITADASFFINSNEGYLISNPTFYPSYLSTGYPAASFLPVLNYNNNRRIGFDFSVNVNRRIGEVDLSLGVSGTYYDTKATKRDEIYDDEYRYREGKPIDGIWGYQSAGLFQNQEDIDNWYDQSKLGQIRPGDIKYIDQNGDNIIDEKDEVFLGKGGWYGSPFTMGINITAKWKGFTIFVLGTGGVGSYGLKNSSYYWIDQEDKYSAVVRNRWTKETASTATYPRLSTLNASQNFCTSDFWMYKANRFDLAKIQITYDLPKQVLRRSFVKELSAFVGGANLLTISKEREHMELNVGSAPQSRYYNIGLKAVF